MTQLYFFSFRLSRPGDPRAAVLLHAAVSERSGDAGESLRGAPAGPGHSPDAPPPRPASLGCLPGLRETAAAGLYSSYMYYPRAWQVMKSEESFKNEAATTSQ